MAYGNKSLNVDFGVDYSLKDFFFDRLAIQAALDKAEHRELYRIGAFLRKRARSILRRRKRVSKPGEPPSVHSKSKVATLKNVLYGYQPDQHNVVTGPVKLNQVNLLPNNLGKTTVPELLEFGLSVVIHEEQYIDTEDEEKWYRRDFRFKKNPRKRYRTRLARYEPRPFMQPALEAEMMAGTLRDVWIGSIERVAA